MVYYHKDEKKPNELVVGMPVKLSVKQLVDELDEIEFRGEIAWAYKTEHAIIVRSGRYDHNYGDLNLYHDILDVESGGIITSNDVCRVTDITDGVVTFQKLDLDNEDNGKVFKARFSMTELLKIKITEVDLDD